MPAACRPHRASLSDAEASPKVSRVAVVGGGNRSTPLSVEEGWHVARLIPVSGIKGQKDQERRATSVLLAVMGAVPDFAHALLCPLEAPRGRIRPFAEVQFREDDGKVSTPDGALIVERGRREWRALVEVKTGGAELDPEQVARYLDMARDHNFDCLITISNQITASPSEYPLLVDGRRLRRVRLYHLSWWRIVTEAVLQHRFRGVSDPDQAWILGELIAYLDHENAGAGGFQDMGERWVRVREAARQGTLRAADPEVRVIAERWEHFLEYLALGLSQDLGRDVTPARRRRGRPSPRLRSYPRPAGSAPGEASSELRACACVLHPCCVSSTWSVAERGPQATQRVGRRGHAVFLSLHDLSLVENGGLWKTSRSFRIPPSGWALIDLAPLFACGYRAGQSTRRGHRGRRRPLPPVGPLVRLRAWQANRQSSPTSSP